ncbi:MAG TPA: hypothetical protein VKU77_19475 [Streptosporangiaceae bacterium]|nr:hypothetical protein [Streptosporangiaceae bacterium]
MIPDWPTWVWGLFLLGLVAAFCVIALIILAVVTVVRFVAGARAHADLEEGDER